MPEVKDKVVENKHQRPEVMTVDELANLLRLNRKTVYQSISNGEIPGVIRVGRKLRISTEAVLRWLDNGQSRPSKSSRRLS